MKSVFMAFLSVALLSAAAPAAPAPMTPPLRGDGRVRRAPAAVKPGTAALSRARHEATASVPKVSRNDAEAACERTLGKARNAVAFAKGLENVSEASLTQGGDLRRQMLTGGVTPSQVEWVMDTLKSGASKMRDAGRAVTRGIESDPEAKRILSRSPGGAGR